MQARITAPVTDTEGRTIAEAGEVGTIVRVSTEEGAEPEMLVRFARGDVSLPASEFKPIHEHARWAAL